MNWLDYLILIALCYAAYRGFRAGLIIELFTLLALLVGLYVAINFSDYASQRIESDFEVEKLYLAPLAFLVTFLLVGAGIYFLGKALEKMIKTTGLSPLNKVAGLAFSLLKMIYILSAGFIFIESLEERGQWEKKKWKEESTLHGTVLSVGKSTIPGIGQSTIFIENALQSEEEETGMTIEDILRAKKIADSLGIEVDDAKKVQEIHRKYGH
ncbi:MAG: CvpA family protein [Bacteroidetes bacterium]|nr:CvpA family protein [Bacteroidota bacterium]